MKENQEKEVAKIKAEMESKVQNAKRLADELAEKAKRKEEQQ